MSGKISIITIFPELIRNFLTTGKLGRAVEEQRIQIEVINFREFGSGNYKQLDDYAFGSGGMLFAAPQLKRALEYAEANSGGKKSLVIYPTPQGELLTQELVESLATQEHLIIICGHYEGIDERFTERYVDIEFSIGDCVLTGGEIPAMALIDALSRLVPGVVGKSEAVIEDSFYKGMLDNPHYTRPAEWEGERVPEILLSGNRKEIQNWRRSVAIKRTLKRRPDLIARAEIRDYIMGGIYLAVIANEKENIKSESLFEIEELRKYYGIERPYIISRNREIREGFKNSGFKVLGNLSKVMENIKDELIIVKVMSSARENSIHYVELKRKILEHNEGILFVLSSDCEDEMKDITGYSVYLASNKNNLPLSLKIAIMLDRILGKR